MFQKTSNLLKQLVQVNSKNFSTVKGGNLYTWGSYCSGTGFSMDNTDKYVNVPKKLEQFEGNVAKVVTGPFHSAVITTEGELWTMGNAEAGALGRQGNALTPEKVDFFANQGLKVVDAALGEQLTIVTTSNGELYSFGAGGAQSWSFLDWLNPKTGALGNGSKANVSEPTKIEGVPKVSQLSVGDNFAIAVTESGEVYNWGCGADGSLADGLCEGILTPQVNENFQILKEQHKLTIKQIKSASHFSVALLSDGNLYAWGRNNQGSLGVRENLGHLTDQIATLPTKINNKAYDGQKIVDYSVGENSLIVLTDKNQVFISGLDLAYRPVAWNLPADKKITKVVASLDSFAALTQDGQLYTFQDFVAREQTKERPGQDFFTVPKEFFENKAISQIGGTYGARFAITN